MTNPSRTSEPRQALEIANRLELFVDDFLIAHRKGVALKLQRPCRMPRPAAPLMGAYMTVVHDGSTYRGFYREYLPGYDGPLGDGNPGERTCYAESADGREWIQPELNAMGGEAGLKNAVFAEAPFAHNLSPFLDTRPGVPSAERFKALAGKRTSGLYAFASADGLQWRKMSDRAVLPHDPQRHGKNAFDSQNVAFWSETEQCYLCYFRHWMATEGGPRTIGRARSMDFLNWEDESTVFATPNLPGEELYTNQTHPYFRAPHLYIALPTRFVRGYVAGKPVTNEQGELLNKGSTDILFMTCRAGDNGYTRTFPEAFIRPGPEPAGWENRANYVALNVVPTGPAEMSIYNRDGHRYVLRTDGFASVHAPWQGGELLTHPLRFQGAELVLNVSTAIRGGLRVEVQDAQGAPLPGFGLEACEPIIGDSIAHTVAWRGSPRLDAHADQPIRLRVVMQDCDLYALRFQ